MKETHAKCTLVLATFFPYITVVVNILSEGSGKLTYICQGLPIDEFQMPKVKVVLYTIIYLLYFGIGILCDVKMILFVKNRNKTQPIGLVPWNSTDPKQGYILAYPLHFFEKQSYQDSIFNFCQLFRLFLAEGWIIS